MADSSRANTTHTTSKTSITRRLWRRTDEPAAWWPWGLLPIAGLAVLFLFGAAVMAPDIQAEIRNSVGEQLGRAGAAVGAINADGQRVSARVGGTNYDSATLTALGEATRCQTWAGALRCPSKVVIEQDAPTDAPAIAVRRPHPFEFIRNDSAVVLNGEVPSIDERDRIVERAGRMFGQVDDRLTVSNENAEAGYGQVADRALAAVDALASGSASWSGEQLSVSGLAEPENIAVARAQFDDVRASGIPGSFDVQALHAATPSRQDCNDRFADILERTTIRFRTSSAEIDADSEPLLAELADVARACPGGLTIAGHTDSRGDAEMNKALSMARAAAVRDVFAGLGVDADRMTAVGHGAAQPVADNDTPEGRASNRRIAITIDPSE